MKTLATPAFAHCARCGREVRISDPERELACPACGGELLPADAAHRPLEHAVTCARCHAVNPHGGDACEECGAPLAQAAASNGAHRPLEHAVTCARCHAVNPHGGSVCEECGAALPSDEAREHRAVLAELRRGHAWAEGVVWLYRTGAAAYAGVTVLAVLALQQPEIPLGDGLLVVAVSALMAVAMLAGALQIRFKPFAWTVAVAALATLAAAFHAVGPNPLGIASVANAVCALVFWSAVEPMRRFQRTIDQHVDEYVTQHASLDTRRAIKGRSNKERHERLLRALKKAHRRAWRFSAVAGTTLVVAAAIGAWSVASGLRPASLDAVLTDFRAAWSTGDAGAIAGFLHDDLRGERSRWIAGVLAGHGWDAAAPPLDEGTAQPDGDGVTRVDFRVAGGSLETRWAELDRRWSMIEIDAPAPPFEPALERMLSSWRRSDAAAVAALFPAGYEDRMETYLDRASKKRGWSRLPRIEDVSVEHVSDGEEIVTLRVQDAVITAKWSFRGDGTWGLRGLQISDD